MKRDMTTPFRQAVIVSPETLSRKDYENYKVRRSYEDYYVNLWSGDGFKDLILRWWPNANGTWSLDARVTVVQ